MDQYPNQSQVSISRPSTVAAASLSESAVAVQMWQHYETVQACEPHLAIGQRTVPQIYPEQKEDGISETHKDSIDQETEREDSASSNQEVPFADEDSQTKDIISSTVAALLPLPPSPSPPDSPESSSLPSSCFVTPASTPSRSPPPPPHSPLYHANNTSSHLTVPRGEFVDGLQDNRGEDRHHGDEPSDPNVLVPHHTILVDVETQTHTLSTVTTFTQTHNPVFQDTSTNTEKCESPDTTDSETQTEWERREVACNTELHIDPELLDRAQLTEQLSHIQSELAAGVLERNEAKSQQMVAEELARIVQSELVELRQRNIAEATTRVRLENQLGELKVELSSARKELQEKEERVTELEQTLKGTSLLVRKLEEMNAVSLMNRGGIDYMLQAKLADARAQEAEQKLEVAQTELLQSQGEVKRLLDRVGETTRDRAEMVSSKVHNQLLKIADERAQAAEQKAVQLERQLLTLHEKYGKTEHIMESSSHLSTFSRPSTYTTTLGGYPSLSSTLLPPYTPSPYSLSTHLPTPTSTTSLEPFKLTFSLPSSNSSLTTSSERATLTNSGRLPQLSCSTDEHTGLLKPSAVLSKSTGSGTHVVWDTSDSIQTASSPTEGQHEIQTVLPSVELPTPDFTIPPAQDGEKEKESSSDWSSSDEDEDGDDANFNPLRPSNHSALQAQWEWRAMGKSLSEKDSVSPMATGHTPRKKPPPVAPKPRVSLSHHSTHTAELDYQILEDPSSFLEPVRGSGLSPLSSGFPRPRGPQGRSLPSQFSTYNHGLFD